MRKYLVIIGIVAITIFCNNVFAAGDKTITSQKYVENQVATKQGKIPAIDTNTVITHTGTNGEIGQKAIYDSSENYVSQQTALMTAGDVNTGINNALENEFICIDWDTDGTCLLWNIKNTSPQRILPEGYTALEYLESTGTQQWIDTGLTANSNTRILARYKLKNVSFTFPISVRDVHDVGQGFSFGVNGTQQFISDYNGDRQVFTTITPNTTDIITLDKNKNVCTLTLNGISETKTNPTSTFETTGTMVFFAQRSAGNISGGRYIFYSFKMWNNGILVREMIPARRDSDRELGMYDLVSNTLFTNQGSGTFTAGPDLDVYIPTEN